LVRFFPSCNKQQAEVNPVPFVVILTIELFICIMKFLHYMYAGYFRFEECGDAVNPTLGMEIGQTYTFLQKDITNYFHPLGFAYFPGTLLLGLSSFL